MTIKSAIYVKDYRQLEAEGISFADFAKQKNFYLQLGEIFHVLNPRTVETNQECDFLLGVAREYLGHTAKASFLDIACGVGRHVAELGRRGYKVTGLDFSQHLIDIAERNSAGFGAEFIKADMREFVVSQPVDVAFSMWDAYVYMSQLADIEKFANSCFVAVKPNGLLVLDSRNYWQAEPRSLLQRKRLETDQYLVERIARRETFKNDRVHESIYTMIIKDKQSGEVSTIVDQELIRLHTRESLQKGFGNRFKIVAQYGDFDCSPYKEDTSHRCIIVAQRQ